MKLSPITIKRQEFAKKLRGFDEDEVRAYLEKIADDIDDLQKENESLNDELSSLKEKIEEYKKIEKNLQDTLLRAQENSTKAIESTKKQTSLMVKEAELKATQIVEKARENANEIRNAVLSLREEKDLLIARLKAIISSQAHLLELKVENVDEERIKPKKKEDKKQLDIDISGIVDKLL